MRIYSVLIILAITLAFFSGRIAFMVSGQSQINNKEVMFLHSLTQEMQERILIHFDINLIEQYPNQAYMELLTPRAIYKSDTPWPFNSTSCTQIIRGKIGRTNFRKSDIWDTFRCHVISSLPDKFFAQSPFMHESGKSYAYLAFTQWGSPHQSKEWLLKHLNYFHIDELRQIKYDLPASYRFLLSLNEIDRMKLVNGNKYFLTDRFLIINNGLLNYAAYPLKMVRHFFNRSGYKLSKPSDKKPCYYQMDQLCISKSKVNVFNRLTETSYLIFAAAIIILLITVSSLYNRIHRQNLEEERKKHALRVLTHELRTPISSLLLQIEDLNAGQENMDQQTQEKLLRLESDIYRLKHLAEKSRGYLQSDSEEFIQFKNSPIDSLNQFINNIIEEVQTSFPDGHIEFNPQVDVACEFDPYWVHICLNNLIENSLRYGKSPTRVSTFVTDKTIEISVADKGSIETSNLKSLLKSKSENSQGMGIGLKIVHKTLKEMGGNLELTANPTTFMMEIPFNKNTKYKMNENDNEQDSIS
jgi:uncharacterized protein YoxC